MFAGVFFYGGIQKVRDTKIATSFFMIMGLPLIPGYSMYFLGHGRQDGAIVPFAGGFTSQEVYGVACTRMNWLSVAIAYLRAYGTALLLGGALGLLFLFAISLGPNTQNPFETPLPTILGVLLAVGLSAVVASYLIGSRVPSRDQLIRTACHDALGIAADPANVEPKTAASWCEMISERLAAQGAVAGAFSPAQCEQIPREVAQLQLLWMRAQLAIDPSRNDFQQLSEAIHNQLTRSA